VNEPVSGSLYAESTVSDEDSGPSSRASAGTLTTESLAGLSARVQALAARLDALEPEIKEVRRRADTLTLTRSGRPTSPNPFASEPQDRSVLVDADRASALGAEHQRQATAHGESKIRRNLVSLLLAQGATMLAALVTVSVVPKYLGAQTFGAFTLATTIVGLFAAVSLLGTNQYLVKTIARDPTRLGIYVFNGFVMKLIFGSVLAVAAVALAHLVGYQRQIVLMIEVGALGMIFATLYDVVAAGLQGTERMGRIALWGGVQQYASIAIAVGLLLAHKGVVIYTLVLAVGCVIPLVANGRHLWPDVRGDMQLDFRLWRSIALGGIPFFLWGALLLVYGSIDIVMLQAMTNNAVVGWYNLAYRWVGIPTVIPFVLAMVALPSLSALAIENPARYTHRVNRAIQVALLAAIPMALGIALVASDIVKTLHYPAGFAHSVVLIRILALHIPVVAMDMVMATALTAKDRQKAWLVVGCVAALFNPTLNLIAIPLTNRVFGDGAIGASLITVATEVVMMIGAIYLRPAGILDRATVFFILRCAGAAAFMIPAVYGLAGQPVAVKVVAGMAAFAVGAWALRLVSPRSVRDRAVRVTRPLLGRDQGVSVSNAVD
jgi:O-antigen/teichoic acid export membrane protein